MSNFTEITTRQLTDICRANLQADKWQPIVVLGAPGSGKSYFGRHTLRRLYAESLGIDPETYQETIGLYVIKPAEKDGIEVAGMCLPMEQDGVTFSEFTLSPVIVGINKLIAQGITHGVLLVDELAQAGIPEQKVLSSLFDYEENTLGNNPIPEGWIVYATGNRAQDKSGAMKVLAHLINRAMFFSLKRDIQAWIQDFAIPHGINPILIECTAAHADDSWFAEEVPAEQVSYCTERSLTQASARLDAIMASLDFNGTLPRWGECMLAANIGEVNARRVAEWIARRDQVPSAQEILRNPETAKVSDNTGFQLIAANVALGAVDNARTATAALHYIMRLRADLQISLGVKLLSIAAKQGWIVTDPAAAAFVQMHHEYLPLAAGK